MRNCGRVHEILVLCLYCLFIVILQTRTFSPLCIFTSMHKKFKLRIFHNTLYAISAMSSSRKDVKKHFIFKKRSMHLNMF